MSSVMYNEHSLRPKLQSFQTILSMQKKEITYVLMLVVWVVCEGARKPNEIVYSPAGDSSVKR